MDKLRICPECKVVVECGIEGCPNCGCLHPEYVTRLAAGEIIYSCGQCHRTRYMPRGENPVITRTQFARIIKGVSLYLPLTTWNTIFCCLGCRGWNWVTRDDRIGGFEMSCPECGVLGRLETLGRHLAVSKKFLHPLVLGELRQAGRYLTLKCGHHLYLPEVVAEQHLNTAPERQPEQPVSDSSSRATLPISAAPTPGTSGQRPAPQSGKKKTQPIPLPNR